MIFVFYIILCLFFIFMLYFISFIDICISYYKITILKKLTIHDTKRDNTHVKKTIHNRDTITTTLTIAPTFLRHFDLIRVIEFNILLYTLYTYTKRKEQAFANNRV